MIKIVKQYKKRNGNGGYDYSEKEMTDIISGYKTYDGHRIFKFYDLIKTLVNNPDGRYMIKKQSLKHKPMSWNYTAFRKTYFLFKDGISFSVNNRKDPDIFYTNNKRIAVRVAKLLTGDYMELVSIVDRKDSGKETYVLNKQQQRSSYKIYVK
jgi:hypothetical protein